MKSINNLLLLGDGESWSRQTIDFAGLPEMVRTFLQVAAGAADVPVTRLLGQSPAGLSATGESDTRNYYDMIAARQELDLRPQLERLDAVLLRAAGVEAGAVRFAFRPLWQLSAAEKAQVALQKAQATAVYAGLQLWPVATTAALVRSQLMEDGTYPGAEGVFGGEATVPPPAMDPQGAPSEVSDYSPDQPRDPDGRWTSGGGSGGSTPERSVTRVGRPAASSSLDPDPGEPGPLGRILGLLNPIGSASAQEAAPRGAGRTIVAAHIHEDPLNNEPPEDKDEEQAKEKLKEIDDPLRGPRVRPDKTLAVPTPMAGGLTPSAGDNPLRRIHPDSTYETDLKARRSLEYWQKQPTDVIVKSLRSEAEEPLTVKKGGAVVNGNTRVKVLQERGYPVDTLPRVLHGE